MDKLALRDDLDAVLVEEASFPAAVGDLGDTRLGLGSLGLLLGDIGVFRGLIREAGGDFELLAGDGAEGGVSATSMAAPNGPNVRQSSC